MNAKIHVKRYDDLKAKNVNWDNHIQEVLRLVLPNHDDVYGTHSPGEKKGLQILDSSATHANELLASALHGMLTNPANYWFWLKTGDPALDENDQIRKWLQRSSMRMHEVMNNSNFQTEIHETYLGLGSAGTWVMFIDEDPRTVVRFLSRPIYQAVVDENVKGEIDTVYRCFKWDKRKIMQAFKQDKKNEKGETLAQVLTRYKDEDEFEILHCAYPRSDYKEGGILPSQWEFASDYVLKELEFPLEESGYKEFPYVVPRWSKISGEKLGRSPGMKCLPDIKMLQAIMKAQIQGLQKTVNPPLLVPDDGVLLPMKLTSGGVNFYRAGSKDEIKPLITDARVDFGQQALEDLRKRIQQAFFIDQLKLREGPQMTATEVNQIRDEQLRMMGPILGRLHHELLRPTITRVFGIMFRKGLFDEMPEGLAGRKLQIQYSSMIAKVQRTSELDSLTRGLNLLAPFIQADPKIMDRFDGDKAAKHVTTVLQWPEQMIRDDSEVEEIQAARADAQRAAADQELKMQQSEQIKNAGPTALEAARVAQEVS